MAIILYKTNVSPPSRAVIIVAKLLKLKYEAKEVSLPKREHYDKEYLEKNPLHTVPVLEDGDLIIADSHAINTYLVSQYGDEVQQKLYPKELEIRAMIDQRLYFDASIMFPRLKAVIYSLVARGQELKEEQKTEIVECYEVLEKYLQDKSYLAADHLTLADISCITTVSSLNCILPVGSKYRNLNTWWDLLKAEEWYQVENVPGLQLFNSFISNFLK